MAYNGWTNRETWLVNLWVGDNLQELQNDGCDITEEFIKEYVDEIIGVDASCVENAFLIDLLGCVLESVNWREIADCYKES